MKKIRKKLIALGAGLAMLASSAVSMSASAADEHYDWGPRYWTPYTGRFAASKTHISAHNMKWTDEQIDLFKATQNLPGPWIACTEYEFRPVGYGTHSIWKSDDSLSSNLPAAYKEFQPKWLDDDDVSVDCGYVAACLAGTSYYGTVFFTAQDDAPTSPQYIFESEYGQTLGVVDAIPSAFEQYNLKDTYFGKSYSW